jgi:Zn finger protein HypA/HybF involved in hydrogenase expression
MILLYKREVKRMRKCENCGHEFEKMVQVGSHETYDPDGYGPWLATDYGCPKCRTKMSSIVYGDQ